MKTILLSLLFFSVLITACEKMPGEGGTSTIRGKVIVREFNDDFTDFRDQYPGAKEDVYIIYGEDEVYGDKFETNYDGTYEFNYLTEGKYRVFAYTDDSIPPFTNELIPVIREVEITGKNQVIEVTDIIVTR